MATAVHTADWIRHHARRTPDRVAVRDVARGRDLTWARLDDRINRWSNHLRGLGVEAGDRVALLARNGSEFFELQGASVRAGVIGVLLNWRLTAAELTYIVGDADASVLVYDRAFEETALEVAQRCGIRHLIAIEDEGGEYEAALADASAASVSGRVELDDPCVLMYTSGTTGHPKGAVISHRMLVWNAVNIGIPNDVNRDSTALVVLPLFHTGGLNAHANPALHAGGTVVILRDATDALGWLGDPGRGVTHFMGVPAVYQVLMADPAFASTDFSHVHAMASGGSPCPEPVADAWARRGVPLLQIYGLTESVILVAHVDAGEAAASPPGAVGRPLMHVDIQVMDPEGNRVPDGAVGELWARGGTVFSGYWRNEAATESAFVDGWFRTGDAARVDEDGIVHIVDRWKDMYKSGGENVYPAEVEAVLYELPHVVEAAVVGVESPRWGETGVAFVVASDDSLTEAAVISHCRARLAPFKLPSRVTFLDELPRNGTGKILKRQLVPQPVNPSCRTPAMESNR